MGHISPKLFVTQSFIGPYAAEEIPAPLQISFKDSGEAIIDLNGYTPKFEIVRIDNGVDPGNLGQGASSVVDAALGIAQYQWTAEDFQTPGMYRGVMWVANGTLRYASIFFEWKVQDSMTTPGVP